VLSIGKMVARSEEYYIRTVATGREEYYAGSGESPGMHHSSGRSDARRQVLRASCRTASNILI